MDQAIAEASRCLLCHDAPCSRGCPAATEPDRFIRKLRLRNLKGAVAVIKENNPLGGVCSVVCPTCSLCEEQCLATGIGEPIRIGAIQRFLVEYGWETGFRPVSPETGRGKKVAVVGGGPSGLTCAAELARKGCEVVIYERLPKAGGMLRYVIPDHRLSAEFVDREIADVRDLGVDIRCSIPIENQADLGRLFADGFEAVYLATGSWMCAMLDVPSRDSGDILDAVWFLNLAKEDEPRFTSLVKGRRIAVIGGGDSALDAAATAKRYGAEAVSLVYRRSFNEMPCSREHRVRAMDEGIDFIILTQPTDYVIEGGSVKALRVVRTSLGEPDQTLRRRPVTVEGSEHLIRADLIVEAIGLLPSETILQLSDLKFDEQNRIVVDERCATSLEKVYAGGDAVRGPSLVARAVGDGKRAAASILKQLNK